MLRLFLVVVLVSALPVQAFDYRTHERICALAYAQVSEPVQQRISELVARSGLRGDFAAQCGWADRIRKQDDFRHTGRWHYVNVPRTAQSVTAADCDGGCVLSAISDMQERLRKAPETDWQALFFLGHFVADVHQPLHVSYADDRGGNDTRIYVKGERSSLHQYWDDTATDIPPPVALAGTASSRPVSVWADESLDKTRGIYQQYRRGMTVTETQLAMDRDWMSQRIPLAAQRLAALLEDIFARP